MVEDLTLRIQKLENGYLLCYQDIVKEPGAEGLVRNARFACHSIEELFERLLLMYEGRVPNGARECYGTVTICRDERELFEAMKQCPNYEPRGGGE